MAHARILGILLLAASVLPGCSSFSHTSFSRYVISNNSAGIVVINYSHPAYFSRDDKRNICPMRPLGALPETTQDKLSSDAIAWQRLALDKFVFNNLECSVRIAIIAGASVTFATRDPLREKTSTTSVDADLIQLNIQHGKGNVLLKGVKKFNSVERNGEKLYVYNVP